MVINYLPLLYEGVYKDTFDDFYSTPSGVICDCSRKKTIFKKIYRFKRHCRGKTHQKYLSDLSTPKNTSSRDVEILDEETEEITLSENFDDIPLNEVECSNMKEIAFICKEKIVNMEGDWVVPKNNYEKNFCDILDWECIPKGRYYDAKSEKNSIYIEIKKGIGGMWLDMIRYSEILLGIGTQDTITVFLNWSKKLKRVNRIYVINTKVLMHALGLTKDIAKSILDMNKTFPGRINHLQCMTQTKIKNIAKHIIIHPQYKNRN